MTPETSLNSHRSDALMLLAAILCYGITLWHGYALDDTIVITENQYTQQGFEGIGKILTSDAFEGFYGEKKSLVAGGRYRPLSLVTFAIEQSLWGQSAWLSHLINLLLLAFTGMVLQRLTDRIFPTNKKPTRLTLGVIAALLFITHPLHTEVVANIKGRDELMALLFSLLATQQALYYLKRQKSKYLWGGALLFALALLSKENSITFLALIPLVCYQILPKTNIPKEQRGKRILQYMMPLLAVTVLFIWLRHTIVGGGPGAPPNELMNNPFLEATGGQKFGTIFYTWLRYLGLLIFPHPLTYDYYPYHISLHNLWHPLSIAGALSYLVLGLLAIHGLAKRKIYGLSIAFYLIPFSLVSNLLFPVGTFMNERFLYFSSVGFVMLLAYALVRGLPNILPHKGNVLGRSLLILLLLAYAGKTIHRSSIWKDNETLFLTDVKTSSGSAKSNVAAGGTLLEKAANTKDADTKQELLQQAENYLQKAIHIHPAYNDALLLLGNLQFEAERPADSTLKYYARILQTAPDHKQVYQNLPAVMAKLPTPHEQIAWNQRLLKHNPQRFELNYQLGLLYGKVLGQLNESTAYFQQAFEANPNHVGMLKDYSVVLGMLGRFEESNQLLERASGLRPNDAQIYINMGINYRQLGETKKANASFQKANQLKSTQP
jgi:tetratricopeptide (TPR) repeat protein